MTKIVSTPIPIESWHHNWIKNVLNHEIWVFIMILLPHKSIVSINIHVNISMCWNDDTGNNETHNKIICN